MTVPPERTILVASPTYRQYGYEWALGIMDLANPPDLVALRLRDLGVRFAFALTKGYGAAKNLGDVFLEAERSAAAYVLTAEWDHDFRARHAAQVIEAADALTKAVEVPVAVGAMYPSSSVAGKHVLAPLHPEGVGHAEENIVAAVESWSELPETPLRYVEAAVLPAGFTLWPVGVVDVRSVEERVGTERQVYWDRAMSEAMRAAGARLYVDLSLDVGHVVVAPVTSVDMVRRGRLA